VRSIIFHFRVLKINYGTSAGRGQSSPGGKGINEGFCGREMCLCRKLLDASAALLPIFVKELMEKK